MAFGKNKKKNQQMEGNVVIHKVAPGENVLYPPREGSILKEMSVAIGCTLIALILVVVIVSYKSMAVPGNSNYYGNQTVSHTTDTNAGQSGVNGAVQGNEQKDPVPVEQNGNVVSKDHPSDSKVEAGGNGDYILQDSDTRYIEAGELDSLSAEELSRARNEIYARHGRLFKDSGLQDYFNSKSWYQGSIAPEAFTEDMLSDVERSNVETIVSVEQAKGYR